jgi:hypothetical protein
MELIEQAVFTSAVTGRAAGYQLVATSPGVGEEDARELAVWGPSHDALLDVSPSGLSLNFHPLPSGAYCVSRTTPSGWEYSERGGARVYTQCFLVPPEILRRMANNPFALLKAVMANGLVRIYDEVPLRLEPFRLSGRASIVDVALLNQLATHLAPQWLATLIQAALNAHTLAIVGGPPPEHLIAGILNCLPLQCRTEFSFSTGLRFSSRRPFRIVALARDTEELRRVQRLYNIAVLDLTGDPPPQYAPNDSWARLIERAIRAGRADFLAAELSQRHFDVALEDLPALGLQLLEELDASCHENAGQETVFEETSPSDATAEPPQPPPVAEPADEALSDRKIPDRLQQAHAAHTRFEKSSSATAAAHCRAEAPSTRLETGNPAVRRRLQQLDALVYEAIAGSDESLEQLKSLWPTVRAELGDVLLARSREEYLRYALAIWEACQETDGARNPQRAIQSLEVLSVLFDEV